MSKIKNGVLEKFGKV